MTATTTTTTTVPKTTTTTAPTGRSTTTTGPTSTSTGAAATSTTAGSSRCATTALSGSVTGSSGAAGTIETTVALKSTAPAPCVLGGYPGLQLVSSSGALLPTNVVRKGNYSFTAMNPTTLILNPGQSAYFNIGYSDVPVGTEGTCPTSASVQVTPPNAYDHLVVAAAMSPCGGGTMVVSPGGRASVQAGAGIVADSAPPAEYREILAKTRIVRDVLGLDA